MQIHFLYFENLRAYHPSMLRTSWAYSDAQIHTFYQRRWGFPYDRTISGDKDKLLEFWTEREMGKWISTLKGVADSAVVFITIPDQEENFNLDIDRLNIRQYLVYRDEECAVNQNYVEMGPRLRTWIFQFPADYKGVTSETV